MGWLWPERRGPAWKQGWAEHTIASISPPPFPLLAIFLIIFLLLFVSSYFNYKYQMQHTFIHFKLFLLFLPVLLIFIAKLVSKTERPFFPATKAVYGTVRPNWDLPWGVAVLLVVLLVMVSYQSSLRSVWSPLVWRSD
ncbi:uncharacterized protein LOC8274663 [Ricinus communis]|uniref:Uncharacterized protein n=1 Tax=Ricinus communis TaxID=3988 RepID=B9R893_RICCO|nr:uncharacterized protein LOC8274663 [Ricinus communis]EEF52723.1 conserved hypothetical protein [Ricinus communis]|eukprot:XP_002510536.1 uncharacterized protein LOC8274663 [Ricinus communis]